MNGMEKKKDIYINYDLIMQFLILNTSLKFITFACRSEQQSLCTCTCMNVFLFHWIMISHLIITAAKGLDYNLLENSHTEWYNVYIL